MSSTLQRNYRNELDLLESSSETKRVRVSLPTEPALLAMSTNDKSAVTPCCSQHSQQLVPSSIHSPTASPASSSLPPSSPLRKLSQSEIDSLLWKEASYSNHTQPLDSNNNTTQKRSNYISWDDYFVAVAALSSMRSKDPQSPTGACLVDERNRIVGIGYNGFPRNCSDDCLPWTFDTNNNQNGCHLTPSHFVVHAEVNAILNKCAADVAGARLYCQSFPCNECAKVIVQSRIDQVIYCHEGDVTSASMRASRILLTMAGVKITRYTPQQASIDLALGDKGSIVESRDESQHRADEAFASSSTYSSASGSEQTASTAFIQETHRELVMREANYDPVATPSTKRSNVLSWDDYFTAMAFLTAQRSKDPNTQVGACLVDAQKRIIGLGYNGFPAGCSDNDLPWARHATSELHRKYLYVCHAEVNAILNKGSANVRGATLYVALFPCNECAKMIVQAGIKEVVFIHDTYHDTDACRASRIMFHMAGVRLRQHTPSVATLRLDLLSSRSSGASGG